MADIEALLDHLIDASPEGAVPVQLIFKLGVQPVGGHLSRADFDGVYKIGTVTQATGQQPGIRAGTQILVEQYFGADSVQSVIVAVENVDLAQVSRA